MNVVDPEKAWAPYAQYLSVPKMAAAIARAVEFASQPPEAIIPSMILMPDGIRLQSIYLVTRNLLAEVSADGSTFDFVDRLRIAVMRWQFGTVPAPSPAPAIPDAPALKPYDTVTVHLLHGVNESVLNFVGENSADWVKLVRSALPTESVLSGRM
jgi:hypothetical protein